jgi:hypothetical protein
MKKLLFAGLLLTSLQTFAGGWEVVTGNGNSKKETRDASGYTAVHSAGAFDVDINYGTSNSITIEADENLLPYIETEVKDNKLLIKNKKGYSLKSKNKMRITVSLTKMTGVQLSGSGNIKGNGAFSNDGDTEIGISGSGDIDLQFASFGSLEAKISGKINAAVSGSGNIDAFDVSANDVQARVSGSGNVNVTANKSIEASISGSGNVVYRGSATDVKSKSSGSGKVRKA